jgi:hypothetical protein
MSSCSASSNIQGTSTVLNPTGGESRLSMKLVASAAGTPTGYTIDSNVFAGGVIRYDPGTRVYSLSQANNNVNAEVVGVVETKNDNGDVTVVLRGLIKYPAGATLSVLSSAGVDGGSGGNDIWFLSAATAGQMQSLEPSNVTEIVKPVMQTVATSDEYNYQVLNYIGYSVGGEIAGEVIGRLPIGSTVVVPSDVNPPVGWIDASKEREVLITTYPEYYSYAGNFNGYVEKITLSSGPPASSTGKRYVQKTAGSISSTSRIQSVNTASKEIFIRKSSSTPVTDGSKNVFIENVDYGLPVSSEIYSIFTPKILPNSNSSVVYYQGGRSITKDQKVLLKIQDIAGVNIPQNVTIKEMFVTDKFSVGNSGASFNDVTLEITNIKSRLDALESKVIGIS